MSKFPEVCIMCLCPHKHRIGEKRRRKILLQDSDTLLLMLCRVSVIEGERAIFVHDFDCEVTFVVVGRSQFKYIHIHSVVLLAKKKVGFKSGFLFNYYLVRNL